MGTERRRTYFDAMVSLAGVTGGISLAVVAVIAVFASDEMMVSAYVVGILGATALALGGLMSRHAARHGEADPRPDAEGVEGG
jgi:hypothetical protein